MTTSHAIQEAAAVIQEEGHRIASLGPVLSRRQAEDSLLAIRFALAKLQALVPLLPSEHPKAPLEPSVGQGMGVWP